MKTAIRPFIQAALCATVLLALLAACSDSQETPQAPTTATASPATAASPAAASPAAASPVASTPAATSTLTPQAPAIPSQEVSTPEPQQPGPAQIDSALDQLLSRIESGAITEAEAAAQTPLNREGTVAVTIELSGDPRETLDLLQSHGISPRHATAHYIEVFVPPLLLREIAEISDTAAIALIVPPQSFQEPPIQSVLGDGPAAHRSAAWNQAGFTGSGIKIGVIDAGYAGADGLLGTELPADPQTRCYTTETDSPTDLIALRPERSRDHRRGVHNRHRPRSNAVSRVSPLTRRPCRRRRLDDLAGRLRHKYVPGMDLRRTRRRNVPASRTAPSTHWPEPSTTASSG